MILYYREPNGDYLAIDTTTANYYARLWPSRGRCYEGRVSCIEGLPTSVNTCAIAQIYLRTCKRIAKRDVPKEWLEAIGLD